MTNEEIAELIYNGQNQLINDLFMQNIRIIYKHIKSLYNRNSERCGMCGIEKGDLLSESYFALKEAVQAYGKSNKKYKLLTFLKFPLLNRINNLIGYRTQTGKKEPLNNAISLDTPIDSDNEDITMLDTLADDTAAFEDNIIDSVAMGELFPAIRKALTNQKQFEVIESRYKYNKPLRVVADELHCSVENVRRIENKAIRELKNPRHKEIEAYKNDFIDTSISRSGLGYYKTHNTSSVEWAVLMRNEKHKEKEPI